MFVDEEYVEEMMQRREGQEPSGLNKYSKRPKLRINKLSDDKRSVSVQLDIEINDKLVIRERFDWSLDYPNVSPGVFAERFCTELALPESNIENIRKQIVAQIIDHIERNTNPNQKAKPTRYETFETDVEAQQFDYLGMEKRDDEEPGGMKQTERQRTLEELRKKGSTVGKFNLDGKKECKYCQTVQVAMTEYCKTCRLPFRFSDHINMDVEREALTLRFLDALVKNIDVIADAELDKILTIDDFKSVYYLRNVLTYKLLESNEVKEDNIGKELVAAIKTIYKEVLSGVEGVDVEKLEEVESKSDENEEKEDASMLEDGESPSKTEVVQKVIRKRGRPPKKNPAPKKFTLRKAK